MTIRIVLPLTIGAALIAGAVHAQDKSAARKACLPDYQKFCSGITVGGGRVKKCLNDNLDKLTPDCRAAVLAHTSASKH